MLLAHRLTSEGLEIVDDPIALEGALWVDVVDPSAEERTMLESVLRRPFDDTPDADEIESSARSFVDESGAHVSTLFLHRVEGRPENTNVTIVVRPDRLLTVHDRDVPALRLLRLTVRRDPRMLADPFGLLIALFETAVDDLGDTLQELYFGLEATGRRVFEESNTDHEESLDALAQHEDLNGKVRLCLMDARRDLTYLLRNAVVEDARQSKTHAKRLRNLIGDIDALLPHNNFLFEKVNFLLQAAQGFINIEQNQIIKIFSVAAVGMMPPTLIASIYGMNFHVMPELSWTFGYPIAIGSMIVSAILPYIYFKRRGWL
ncbi:MAG TPA: magnesium/cobalt transporter CorA [Pseudomonadales bacterium]|jgi:magnesium transporter|nr:magnesium/cobalt transporter CorA [Pseudomonadales bacterium]